MTADHRWPADNIPGLRPLTEAELARLEWLRTRRFRLSPRERDELIKLDRRAPK
jgi:hypothetical protein